MSCKWDEEEQNWSLPDLTITKDKLPDRLPPGAVTQGGRPAGLTNPRMTQPRNGYINGSSEVVVGARDYDEEDKYLQVYLVQCRCRYMQYLQVHLVFLQVYCSTCSSVENISCLEGRMSTMLTIGHVKSFDKFTFNNCKTHLNDRKHNINLI